MIVFSHVPELNRLGANINTEKNSAFVKGVKGLKGAPGNVNRY